MKCTKYVLAVWLLSSLAGCASFNDAHYEHTQKARARAAWRCVPERAKQHCYPKDYEQGWKDGFYDVATGGKGCPPVVAPQKYWRPEQILESCDNERHAYYDGFQDGVACGLRYPDTHHLKLWTSCECPLPRCEYQCAPGMACPTGGCGFTAFPDAILESEFESSATPLPQPMESSPAALVTPEVVPIAPASKGIEPAKGVKASADSVQHQTAIGSGFEFVRHQVDDLKRREQTAPNGRHQTSPIAAVRGPISDPVWLEMESELKFESDRHSVPSASDTKPTNFSPNATKSETTVALPKPSTSSKPVVQMAEPLKPSVPKSESAKSNMQQQSATSQLPKGTVSNPGMIEQSMVEMASPIVAPNWGVTNPIVEMAAGLQLNSK